jgi:hypothetical protein
MSIINRPRDFTSKASLDYLRPMMQLIINVCTDDVEEGFITNVDAFAMLLHLLTTSQVLEVLSLTLDSVKVC